MASELPNPNDDKNIVFETPVTTVSEIATSENFDIEFEKYKMKMNFFKWLLGTFAVAIMTIIINWGFKDRSVGMNEISQYDRYTTDLLVLNDNPVKKRMLAQFFATVTPSSKLKEGWQEYYAEVNKDYMKFIKSDSIIRSKYYQMSKDTSQMNTTQKAKLKATETIIKQNDSIKNAPIIIPATFDKIISTGDAKKSILRPTVYLHYNNKDKINVVLDYQTLLKANNWIIPKTELVPAKYQNIIKYFHPEDRNLAEDINKLLSNKFRVVSNLEFGNTVPNRQLEIWINNN
jgi:predicted phosphatase